MPRPLHVILGDQTAQKLDEITIVTEESKTAVVARLIRDEWERERAKAASVVQVFDSGIVGQGEAVARELSFQMGRDLSTSPEDAVRRRRAEAFERTQR